MMRNMSHHYDYYTDAAEAARHNTLHPDQVSAENSYVGTLCAAHRHLAHDSVPGATAVRCEHAACFAACFACEEGMQ